MAIADEELSVRRVDVRSGQWVEITMKKALNSSFQNEITKLSLENESLKDEISDLKKVIKKWTSSRVALDQLLTKQVLRNIVRALGGKGIRKDKISSKEVVFTKSDVSLSKTSPELPSDSKSEGNTQRPLPSLPKLMRAEPFRITKCLTITKTKQSTDKVVPLTVKQKAETKPSPDSSTEKLLLTLMEEVKGLLKEIYNSSDEAKGYGSVNCNGITFTKVAYVNGLKHNLISISQLCYANFKVLFTKTHGTIFNQNNEVVLIDPRRRDVYVIDMTSYNEEINACFFSKASPNKYSRYTWVFCLKKKSDAADSIIFSIKKMENLNEVKVKELRSDNETEFKNHKLEEFCDENGIS
ncbi:retrovirus-related pol polyprotein from transposon TNT 1-94 [Tanacetum coccineum]